MKWTNEQAQAIDTRNLNILVSASAGSGKTAVLVERILNLVIENKRPLTSFLIVTFTNAAAAEMRERIAKRLMSLLSERSEDAKFISEQIQSIQQANISTLHSFCKEVIRQNFFHLDIDPNFIIGNQQVLELKQKDAMDLVFDNAYEVMDEAFESVLGIYSSHRSDDLLKEFVKRIYDFSRAHPYPEEWLDACVGTLKVSGESAEEIPYVKAIKENVLETLTLFRKQLESAHGICLEPGGPEDYSETLSSDLDSIDSCLDGLSHKSYDQVSDAINQIAFVRLKTIKKANKELVDIKLVAKVKNCRDGVKKAIKKMQENYFAKSLDAYMEDLNQMAPHLETLVDLVSSFAREYEIAKREDNLLDFNDLEQYAIKVLNSKEVADMYRNKFDYIFIDEYQDSNRVQEEIASLIKRDNNLFLVGDVKQSIYRFRMAEPGLFLEKFDEYPSHPLGHRVDLNMNFRSHKDVLIGINTLFDTLLTKGFGGIAYKEDGRLIPGRTDFMEAAKPRLNLAHYDEKSDSIAVDAIQMEAHLIKERVKALQGEMIYDTELKSKRSIRLSDIVILMRSIKGKAQQLRDELSKYGIPVIVDEEDSYFDIIEVATVINLLRIIDNAHQDIPLLSVMRSSIGGFSDEELARIRTINNKSYYDTLFEYGQAGEEELLRGKVVSFLRLIENLRAESRTTISEFLWYALTETGYYHFVNGLEDGEKRKQHLDVLIEKAEQFETERQSGIHHFVDYLDQMKEAKVSYGGKANNTDVVQAIRVMSIHKSKGLEFPVVILAGMSKNFNMMDIRSKLVFHQETGLTTKWIDPVRHIQRDTLPFVHLKNVLRRETILEEVRILYVAMTRAVYRLEVCAVINKFEKAVEKWQDTPDDYVLSNQTRFIDWFMSILMHTGEVPEDLVTDRRMSFEGNTWSTSIVPMAELLTKQFNTRKEVLGNASLALEQVDAVEMVPFDGHSYGLPAKLSVTELKNKSSENVFTPRITALTHYFETQEEALERGNVYHLIMEHMPLDRQPVKSVLELLLKRNVLTEEMVELIEEKHVEEFRNSSVYQRMISALKVWKEQPFVFEKEFENGEKTLVQGIVDAMFLEEDGIVLIDYKSDRVQEAGVLVKRYKEQIDIYAQAIESVLGHPVKEKMIYALSLNQWIEV
ncbi:MULTISPECIES: helicase-exonuclease AddAB subunit AddA [unclassified Fusibacter]|uniref:helicase-exonuclease AddAB subunit AddA n=1 Tax=unclassified Fusibacter TaxID=2624464 RepID=UPI0013E91120|nr:helicase-exonuclease AddAB subunit AddA [Fusibacter sp. A1]MCK8061427.1 helicase-exonuclease AddAB subunit AddA [Fusibacter sp. A2]NPE23614.1 helicase-exonuclease AddAB subunit AddA [Fusibacter sp. A1]